MDINQNLNSKISLVPKKPGVYIFHDKEGQVLYVGKAASLYHRLRSYFLTTSNSARINSLIKQLVDFDYLVTDTETEAYILEDNLIKKYSPKFNVRLRDDKTYPYIKITTSEDFPRLLVVRKKTSENDKYFGPYTSVNSMQTLIKFILSIFPIATCKKPVKISSSRPCLQFQIKRCSAPCANKISKEEYRKIVQNICAFLEGKSEIIIKDLRKLMKTFSDTLKFEKAAELRDKIKMLKELLEKQKMDYHSKTNEDIIGVKNTPRLAVVCVLIIRQGKLLGKENFILEHNGAEVKEILNTFIKKFYRKCAPLPENILVGEDLEEREEISKWLSTEAKKSIKIKYVQKGKKKELLNLAERNAEEYLTQQEMREGIRKKRQENALKEIKTLLKLKSLPLHLEGLDVSCLLGKDAYASVVVFWKGEPLKQEYRIYQIKDIKGIDDYGMLSEVLRRRYGRLQREGKEMPDVILVDGGKGQLSTALKVLKRLNLEGIKVLGIAKGEEIVYLPDGSSLSLPPYSPALQLIQHIRDEAHRFALKFHRRKRQKIAIRN